MNKLRTYTELNKLKTFEERFKYLKLDNVVGEETFGFDRWLNQQFYKSKEWRRIRDYVIARDCGCDLGAPDHEIIDERILIHHINPITVEDVLNRHPKIFDMENAVSTSFNTHRAIHYGDESLLVIEPNERSKNDTCPWRK